MGKITNRIKVVEAPEPQQNCNAHKLRTCRTTNKKGTQKRFIEGNIGSSKRWLCYAARVKSIRLKPKTTVNLPLLLAFKGSAADISREEPCEWRNGVFRVESCGCLQSFLPNRDRFNMLPPNHENLHFLTISLSELCANNFHYWQRCTDIYK